MTQQEAGEILRKVEYWHYPFDLPWGRTVPSRPGVDAQRHFLRKRHFLDPLVELYGGSLAGKDVLDLACCQGFWSFQASHAGARSCIGIDSSESFVREAAALAEMMGIGNCAFRHRHLEQDDWWAEVQRVHVTLFLGLFYHLADPIFVFRKAAALTLETMIVDTEISTQPGSLLEIVPRDPHEPTTCRSNISSKFRIVPTRQAVHDLLVETGFADIRFLEPRADMPADYLAGRRASAIAQRRTAEAGAS
jgi:SAM-dependent methyltransferase